MAGRDVPLQAAPELLPAVAHALARQADRALQQGVLQGYRQVEDSLPVLRAVRESDQLRQRFASPSRSRSAMPRLNVRDHVALRPAEVVLSAQSFEQRRGELRASGFLFDLAKVFEDFVCVALREELTPRGGQVELQTGRTWTWKASYECGRISYGCSTQSR